MNRNRLNAWLGAGALLVAGAAQGAGASLDRAGLLELADSYFGALVAHDPARVPLAAGIRTVENITAIRPGEGLWKTASSGPTAFRIVAADPVSQQVGGIVVMGSEGKPVQFGFRLKVEGGRIAEAEHLVVPIRDPANPLLQEARPAIGMEVPYEYADSRGRLLHIARAYYDALDLNNGGLAPFGPDCERRENGMRTAPFGGTSLTTPTPAAGTGGAGGAASAGPAARPPGLLGMQDCAYQLNTGTFQYIDTIDHRRVDIADTVTGVAIGFSHFRHPMTTKKFRIVGVPGREEADMSTQQPFDMPALHLYKIWGGQIHEIEAIGIMAPYDSPTGWE